MPKRAAKFENEEERGLKNDTLSLTCDQCKGEMVEYPTMGNALLYETKMELQ